MTLSLPSWASQEKSTHNKVSIVVKVDSAAAYKDWLERLGNPEVDQYWLEVAYQCIKLDVQMAIAGTEFDPRTAGKSAEFRFSNAPEFALKNHPEGKGAALATKGLEARNHYVRIRGAMPF